MPENLTAEDYVEGRVDLSDWHFLHNARFDDLIRIIVADEMTKALSENPPVVRLEIGEENEMFIAVALTAFNESTPPTWRFKLPPTSQQPASQED
jgi:hypothetical protein